MWNIIINLLLFDKHFKFFYKIALADYIYSLSNFKIVNFNLRPNIFI